MGAQCAGRGTVVLLDGAAEADRRGEARALRDLLDAQIVVSAVGEQRPRQARASVSDLAGDRVLDLGEDQLELAEGGLHLAGDPRGVQPRVAALLGDEGDCSVAQGGVS